MTPLRQITLIAALIAAFAANNFAGSMKREIATGAATDSAANQNTVAITQYGSYGAGLVAVLAALGSRVPLLNKLLSKLGGAETLGRVVDGGAKLIDSKGRDTGALLDVFRLVVEKGVAANPEVMQLLGRLNLHLGDHPPPEPPISDLPTREVCLAQLVRRIELDAAAKIAGTT